jgi:hypothetical protein
MSRIVGRPLSIAACMMSLAGWGCGGDGATPNTAVAPQLPAERAAALEFWWGQGQGERGQHLVVARGSSGGAELTLFELEPGGAWQRLFAPSPAALSVTTRELALDEGVNRAVRGMIATRVTNELGGRAPFERLVEPSLLEAEGAEPLEAVVLGSFLMVVPSALDVATHDAWCDALVFAHAAALRREASEGDAAAYGQTLDEVLTTVGWVATASASTVVSSAGSSRSDLLDSMARAADAEPWLRALGLLD